MRRKTLLAAAAAVLLFGTFATPAQAVTDGVPDGDGHPHVGIMVATDEGGTPMWRCTGTLISPTLFLTAGHCTSGAAGAEVWFASDLEKPGTEYYGYPYTGEVSGTAYTHPQYEDAAFYLYDLGMVVLDTPVYLDEYGTLPTLNQLDALSANKGKKDVTFTSVGYGLQKAFPDSSSVNNKTEALRTRMVAYPKLNSINTGYTGDFSMILSNNAKTGGTCFGDSGGPNFLGDTNVIAGVTSFGKNSTCAGTGGVYRIDRADDLDWISTFFTE
jgi:V8-like Glu-specific endopeptidase